MLQELEQLINTARQAVQGAESIQALDQVRVDYLGKKGQITLQMKSLGKLSAEERPKAGQMINAAKQQVQQAIEGRKKPSRMPNWHCVWLVRRSMVLCRDVVSTLVDSIR